MVVNVLEILSKDHSKWLKIAQSFGLEEQSEDLVQDMYLKIYSLNGRYNETLMYNETEVNYYFIFKILRNMFLDKCKKKQYTIRMQDSTKEPTIIGLSYELEEQIQLAKDEINSWHLYDRKIYELLFEEGYNMSQLSQATGIDYHAIRRTKIKIEKLLNEKLFK